MYPYFLLSTIPRVTTFELLFTTTYRLICWLHVMSIANYMLKGYLHTEAAGFVAVTSSRLPTISANSPETDPYFQVEPHSPPPRRTPSPASSPPGFGKTTQQPHPTSSPRTMRP